MKRKNLIKLFVTIIFSLFSLNFIPYHANAGDLDVEWFNIMPKLTDWEVSKVNAQIKTIWSEWWQVWKHYNDEASRMKTSEQIASWVMTWDTVVNYLVFIIRFLSELWLLVWAAFIIVAWYRYMSSAFSWAWTSKATWALKSAVIWVLIVIFSYAIMRILTSFIWLT